jgi:hypothetical protein
MCKRCQRGAVGDVRAEEAAALLLERDLEPKALQRLPLLARPC